jgi:hypothetical protein
MISIVADVGIGLKKFFEAEQLDVACDRRVADFARDVAARADIHINHSRPDWLISNNDDASILFRNQCSAAEH